jgi:hypothetical protein
MGLGGCDCEKECKGRARSDVSIYILCSLNESILTMSEEDDGLQTRQPVDGLVRM